MSEFTKKFKDIATDIRIAGYSRGGGTIQQLAYDEDWRNDLPVKTTIMPDAVDLDCSSLGGAVHERPEFETCENHRHRHIFQIPYVNPYDGPASDYLN